ncbi:MAG: hypothetical protein V1736_00975 [Pseudomonadota bacterium]
MRLLRSQAYEKMLHKYFLLLVALSIGFLSLSSNTVDAEDGGVSGSNERLRRVQMLRDKRNEAQSKGKASVSAGPVEIRIGPSSSLTSRTNQPGGKGEVSMSIVPGKLERRTKDAAAETEPRLKPDEKGLQSSSSRSYEVRLEPFSDLIPRTKDPGRKEMSVSIAPGRLERRDRGAGCTSEPGLKPKAMALQPGGPKSYEVRAAPSSSAMSVMQEPRKREVSVSAIPPQMDNEDNGPTEPRLRRVEVADTGLEGLDSGYQPQFETRVQSDNTGKKSRAKIPAHVPEIPLPGRE